MKAVTLWHNPRCSKSRQALELLRERGVEPEVVEYLKDPPSAQELGRVLKLLGMEPRDLMRKKEPPYRELGLANASLGRDALIAAMVEHPILIERPVVIAGSRAVLARPPDLALALLD
jgi:arsenate reductase (glutaredoxin)